MTEMEASIMTMIDRIRAQHHACTAGAVAAELHCSKAWVVQLCERMKADGLINWTSFPGSLHTLAPVPVLAPVSEVDEEGIPLDPKQRRQYYGQKGAAVAALNRAAKAQASTSTS
jgi:hypothetical protein